MTNKGLMYAFVTENFIQAAADLYGIDTEEPLCRIPEEKLEKFFLWFGGHHHFSGPHPREKESGLSGTRYLSLSELCPGQRRSDSSRLLYSAALSRMWRSEFRLRDRLLSPVRKDHL